MAAKLARPEKEVVCLFGDGAFAPDRLGLRDLRALRPPFIGVVGNNSHMNQIRYGQIAKYGKERGEVGNTPRRRPLRASSPRCSADTARRSASPEESRPALQRARANPGNAALINVWVDPDVYAPGTMNQTMYK